MKRKMKIILITLLSPSLGPRKMKKFGIFLLLRIFKIESISMENASNARNVYHNKNQKKTMFT